VTEARTLYSSTSGRLVRPEPVTVVDLIDRLLSGGVVVQGHITLALADINLIDLDIALLVASTATLARQ